jgi:hypothetical protein
MSTRPRTIDSKGFKERLVQLCLKSGSARVPRKVRDRHIILKSVALTLDRSRALTAQAVNDAIERWLWIVGQRLEADVPTLRRMLVAEGYLRCDARAKCFVVSADGPNNVAFTGVVEKLDVFEIALHGVCEIEQRRRDRFPKPDQLEGIKIMKARMVARQIVQEQVDIARGCEQLALYYDDDWPFLSDLLVFRVAGEALAQNDLCARSQASDFLRKTDEWVESL